MVVDFQLSKPSKSNNSSVWDIKGTYGMHPLLSQSNQSQSYNASNPSKPHILGKQNQTIFCGNFAEWNF